MLPLFGISSDQLSELLLINIGSAADILDLFESFNEEAVINNFPLQISILCLWQASLLQFCFNKTSRLEASMSSILTHSTAPRSLDSGQHNPFQAPAVADTNQNCCLRCCKRKKKVTRLKSLHEVEAQARRSKKKAESQVRSSTSTAESQSRSSTNTAESQSRSSTSTAESQVRSSKKTAESQEEASELTEECTCCCHCWHSYFLRPGHFGYVLFGTELWAIIMTLMLQDMPFLILRLMLIFRYNVQSYQNIFFTVKNLLLILAQVFRSTILVQAHWSTNKLLGRTRVYRPR
ncbi:unnamed protein product [Dibothriocephalus latus]|uniref:Uncharacterized protein n=1 Tax=Dibothriocephalus latus TaxID=60516 RepID=A0A3P7P716_DIBLA|nr:unnamed protein product [Dibothriocephalus latus]